MIEATDFIFRKACESDFAEILELYSVGIKRMIELGIEQWDEEYPNAETIQKDLSQKHLYLSLVDDSIAAAIAFNQSQDPEYDDVAWKWRDARIGVIHRLCVHPCAQGKSVGKNTVIRMEAEAKKQGFTGIRLDTFSKNPIALGLYESLGYRRAGQIHLRKGLFYCFEKPLV